MSYSRCSMSCSCHCAVTRRPAPELVLGCVHTGPSARLGAITPSPRGRPHHQCSIPKSQGTCHIPSAPSPIPLPLLLLLAPAPTNPGLSLGRRIPPSSPHLSLLPPYLLPLKLPVDHKNPSCQTFYVSSPFHLSPTFPNNQTHKPLCSAYGSLYLLSPPPSPRASSPCPGHLGVSSHCS